MKKVLILFMIIILLLTKIGVNEKEIEQDNRIDPSEIYDLIIKI
jgi:hypothetical protein